MYEVRFSRIMAKLDRVRELGRTCLGSDQHKFVLNTTLTESEVAAFESKHRITLPADYRAFLLQAGNGGAGPYYGLLPLERWNDGDLCNDLDLLSNPSLLTPDLTTQTPLEERFGFDWERCLRGAITICHQGCAYYALLIVTGAYRGFVVNINSDGSGALFSDHADFLSWYERWLDDRIEGRPDRWYGLDASRSERESFGILQGESRSGAGDNERLAALISLRLLRRVSRETKRFVVQLLNDESYAVRSMAASLIGHWKFKDGELALRSLLERPDCGGEGRCNALRSLGALGVSDIDALCRALLGGGDPDVVIAALNVLADRDLVSLDDLQPLLGANDARVRRLGFYQACEHLTPERGFRLTPSLLNDPDETVRRNLVKYAAKCRLRELVPALIDRLEVEDDFGVQRELLFALGEIGDAAAIPTLIQWARRSDAQCRVAAVQVLGKFKDERCAAVLRSLADNEAQGFRSEAGDSQADAEWVVGHAARTALSSMRVKRWWQFWR